jgi:GTP-sensing pleiotropic transcriptional regulator CodY
VQQVPEARDLIPVMDGKKRIGTLIVSVVDEPFSASNPEHVKIANAIEERLVDQDLLPLFTEL